MTLAPNAAKTTDREDCRFILALRHQRKNTQTNLSLPVLSVRFKPIFRYLSRTAAGAVAFIAALVFTVLGFSVPASGQG